MPKVYARGVGAEIRVGNYGLATDMVPVEVPLDVAAELATNPRLRMEAAHAPRRKVKEQREE